MSFLWLNCQREHELLSIFFMVWFIFWVKKGLHMRWERGPSHRNGLQSCRLEPQSLNWCYNRAANIWIYLNISESLYRRYWDIKVVFGACYKVVFIPKVAPPYATQEACGLRNALLRHNTNLGLEALVCLVYDSTRPVAAGSKPASREWN